MTDTNAETEGSKNIVFFDGMCNLCNHLVDFLIKRDRGKNLFYCSLQNPKALDYINQKDIEKLNTLFFLHNKKIYKKSTAALLILIHIYDSKIPLKIFFKTLLLVPSFIRDLVYKVLSLNRYRIFGKRQSCRVPTDKEKEQFIC